MKVSTRIDFSQALKKLEQLPQKIQDKAIQQTINQTARDARSSMKSNILEVYGLPSSKVNDQLKVKKASNTKTLVQAVLYPTFANRSKRLNVIHFGASFVQGRGKKRYIKVLSRTQGWKTIEVRDGQGVSARITKGGKRDFFPGAWIATANGGRAVFNRKTPDDYKASGVTTIDVPQMFNSKRIYSKTLEQIKVILIKDTEAALRRFSKG